MGKQLPVTLLKYFKTFPPRTPSLRNKRLVNTDHLYQGPPIPSLMTRLQKHSGRCTETGRITVRHQGGGDKWMYRMIDWQRKEAGKWKVIRLEKDPNRTAWLALLKKVEPNQETKLKYILAHKTMQVGDMVESGENIQPLPGNCLPLKAIPPGTLIHSIGLRPNEAGKLCRSAGTYAQLLRTAQSGYAHLKLSSGEIRLIPVEARATIGTVSNPFHQLEILGSAGANRRKGIRPSVRGVAMNPVDHPMGGRGKGRGMPSTSPWGKITKGVFTVKKHLNEMIIKCRPTRNMRKKQRVTKKFLVEEKVE